MAVAGLGLAMLPGAATMQLAADLSDNSNIITNVGVAIAAIIGAYASLRGRRDRVDSAHMKQMSTELRDLNDDLVALMRYVNRLRRTMADEGLPVPKVPRLKSDRKPDEDDDDDA